MTSNSLEIYLNIPVKFFLHHAIPLSMLLVNERNINIVHAGFFQLYKPSGSEYILDMYPRFGSGEKYGFFPFDSIFDNIIITEEIINICSKDLHDFIINWIDNGFYVNISIDERFIKGFSGTNRQDFHCHQGFIFGYNTVEKIYSMLSYNKDMSLTVINVSFAHMEASFNSIDLRNYLKKNGFASYLIQLRRIRQEIIDRNFSNTDTMSYIKRYLYDFYHSLDSSAELSLQITTTKKAIWGQSVYDFFILALQEQYSTKYLLHTFCGLVEHKEIFEKKLLFLMNNGVKLNEECFFISKNNAIQMKKLRNIYIKSKLLKINRNIFLLDGIKRILEDEKILLENVLERF